MRNSMVPQVPHFVACSIDLGDEQTNAFESIRINHDLDSNEIDEND
jgi:hypothetical protein